MYELLDLCFDRGISAYVAVTKYRAKWIPDPSNCFCSFNKKVLKNADKNLLHNFFKKTGTRICQGLQRSTRTKVL